MACLINEWYTCELFKLIFFLLFDFFVFPGFLIFIMFITQGAANKAGHCTTCHGGFTDCPGHFGYVKLALPVYNIGFFSNDLDLLKCICKVLKATTTCYFPILFCDM
jgi:RNA polymerase Rpb1, domain 1